jgi:hypothetical protein
MPVDGVGRRSDASRDRWECLEVELVDLGCGGGQERADLRVVDSSAADALVDQRGDVMGSEAEERCQHLFRVLAEPRRPRRDPLWET